MTQQKLKKYLHYNPITGIFTWIARETRTDLIGTRAGSLNINGYRNICFCGKRYKEHRLAWLYMFGTLPSQFIDHINGVRNDNRIENLREVTGNQNQYNAKTRNDSSSKIKGVSWHKATKKWAARIKFEGKDKHLGVFPTVEEAIKAVTNARTEHHGIYANHG